MAKNLSSVLGTNSSSSSAAAISGLSPTAIKASAYTAVSNDLVRCNTTISAFSVSLPANPTDGDKVGILDVYGTFKTNNLTLLPLGSKSIEGDATSLILDINGTYLEFMYVATTSNWRLLETPSGSSSSTSAPDFILFNMGII